MSINKNEILIFDTTLRDGEQSPGASMSIQQKVELAIQLEKLGVDIIEAGFPVSSPAQFAGVEAVSNAVKNPIIAALARAVNKDIEIAANALKNAKNKRIHTFIATSPIHMESKLNKKPAEVLKMAEDAIKFAKSFTDDVEFSAEDATRSDIAFLAEIVEAAINAGATTINIPDTTGYTIPTEYSYIFNELNKRVSNIDQAILSVHCHNDLGMAVANSLAGVQSGVRQVEVSMNGIGERAGNAALEEIVMALYTRKDYLGFNTNINKAEIFKTGKLLSSIIGMPIPANKAIIGKNAFAHEAGIHQDGVLKNRNTYEIMTPESIGRKSNDIVLGRHSGKHGFLSKIKEMGYGLKNESIENAYQRFLEVADKKRTVYDDDIIAIIEDEMQTAIPKTYKLKYLSFFGGANSIPTATIVLEKDDIETQEAATGDGPVDAIYRAIDRIIELDDIELVEYNLSAITGGTDAMGEVSVQIEYGGKRYSGRASSTDIVTASCRAYLNGINRILGILTSTGDK